MASKRTEEMTSFIVMDVLERACALECEGKHIVHLEVGEPDFDTPECVKAAACKALTDGFTHYTHSLGLPELREAICEYYHDTYGVFVDPGQVVVTSGSSPAIFMTFAALLEPGDPVILSDPHYACYPNFIKFVGGEPVRVPVFEEDGFQYRPEAIEEKLSDRTRAIFINSPSNPTGNLLSKTRMEAIAGMPPWIVSDEIYHGLVYEGKEHSILEFTDHAFVLNGFSKLFAMTGLRLGYLIAPKEFIRPIQKVQQNFFISANAMIQKAGIVALKEAGDDVARMKRIYNERRIFMIRRLREMGLGITVEPTGAFYVFANITGLGLTSKEVESRLLDEFGVAGLAGTSFGSFGEGYLRFSYANSQDNIKKALDRFAQFAAAVRSGN